ncbi:hypothetical protein [Dermabacter hominis]|uniref:hypothetical protein n=1 Tax=Dermabacter hominis TaxID=36740 RepID=UPI003183E6EB
MSLSAHEAADAEHSMLRRALPADLAGPLGEYVSPMTPVDAIRNLVYMSAASDEGEQMCCVEAVLDIGGVWVAHRDLPISLASMPELAAHLEPAWKFALEAAEKEQIGPVTGVGFQCDRTGEVVARIFTDLAQPPADSGADFHVWHLVPELDELWERVKPESWWERRLEDLQTLLGRVRTRGQGGV